jgi:hypothetical protein
MVNKRIRARVLLALVRKRAREYGLRLEEAKGRGKGSHQIYFLWDEDTQVGRFVLPHHPGDLGWSVLQSIEDGLGHLFGEKWMEK